MTAGKGGDGTGETLRAVAERFCAWCETDGGTFAAAVHAAVGDVVSAYRVCAALPVTADAVPVPPAHPEIAERLAERINGAISATNAEAPELIPIPPVHLRGLPRLYDYLSPLRHRWEDGSLPGLRAAWAVEWGEAVLDDAGRLHDGFALPVVTPRTVEPHVPEEDIDALRSAAVRFCSWCEADTALTPASVQAAIGDVLDLYQRCARIPEGLRVSTIEPNIEMPNPEFPEMYKQLWARCGFHPGGLDDLYDYAWTIKHAGTFDEDLLFSLYDGWSGTWGGTALRDCGRLHAAFPPVAASPARQE